MLFGIIKNYHFVMECASSITIAHSLRLVVFKMLFQASVRANSGDMKRSFIFSLLLKTENRHVRVVMVSYLCLSL